ncbi:MAG TPA: hypothetical protein VGH20_08375 [Myxococcales bacterium]
MPTRLRVVALYDGQVRRLLVVLTEELADDEEQGPHQEKEQRLLEPAHDR